MSGSKFFSFRQPPDWRRGTSYQIEQRQGGLTITSEQVYRHERKHLISHPGLTPPITDTVVDNKGRWLLMDQSGVIWRTELTSSHVESIVKTVASKSGSLARFTATDDSVIILLPDSETILQSVSIESAQIRWTTTEWKGQPYYGYALAADRDKGLVVLANLDGSHAVQLLRFNNTGEADSFIALPMLEETDLASVSKERFEITIDSGGQGWLLDKEKQMIVHIQLHTNTARLLTIPEGMDRVLSICGSGNQMLWGLLDTEQDTTLPSLVQLSVDGMIHQRGYTGNEKGDRIIAGKGCLYLLDAAERYVHTIRPTSETAIWEPLRRRLGVWLSDALDSGEEETLWHKIVMDDQEENDTQVIIRCYASDSKEAIVDHMKVDLDHYIADSSISPELKLEALSGLWSKSLADPKDALLLDVQGRYLWLYMELIGSEQHAPVIHSLEVHFPRSTYLEYLPSIYQRHEPTRDFLARYLSIFQTMLDETDQKVAQVTRAFDVSGADGGSLRWLLGWLGIKGEDYWTEEQLRRLLREAPTIYNLRGTKYAMETLISIFTGEKPIILEYEQVKPLKENPELGEVAERLYAAEPNVFNVLVKSEHADTEMKRVTLQQLIDAFKPAFATCKLIILQPWVYMDLHSYLGMNTVLSEPTLLTLDGRSSMPHHTITIDLDQDNRMDQHTRLGLDSRLE
jgi:phage tail-like protein